MQGHLRQHQLADHRHPAKEVQKFMVLYVITVGSQIEDPNPDLGGDVNQWLQYGEDVLSIVLQVSIVDLKLKADFLHPTKVRLSHHWPNSESYHPF